LAGFVIGSLNKIWPWKKTITTYMDSHGMEKPLLEQSISPYNFNGNNQLTIAILLAIIGFLVIFILEKVGAKYNNNSD
jgi:putative membrane protein